MRVVYALPHARGRFYLPSRIREWLQLPRDCLLHGKVIWDVKGPALILSPIPCRHWQNCYRITVNTSDHSGALSALLSELSKHKLTVLHMIAAAVTPTAELSITAIVAPIVNTPMYRKLMKVRPDESSDAYRKIADEFDTRLKKQHWLSASLLYEGKGLQRVRIAPLRVLRALDALEVPADSLLRRRMPDPVPLEFTVNLSNGLIDLAHRHLFSATGRQSPHCVYDLLVTPSVARSMSLMITADPEDYHFRVAFLRQHPYVQVDIPVEFSGSGESKVIGVSEGLAKAFSTPGKAMNIYYASSVTTHADGGRRRTAGAKSKNGKARSHTYHESIRMRVVADVSSLPNGESLTHAHRDIRHSLTSQMKTLSKRSGVRVVRPTIKGEAFPRIHPMLAPLVFVATNVKPSMDAEYIDYAMRVFALVKSMYLRPVFVPTILGDTSSRSQMTQLLDICPAMVSLYLPETDLELRTVDVDVDKGDAAKRAKGDAAKRAKGDAARRVKADPTKRFASSTWTTFEEAYMTALRNRHVFRLSHADVYSPPFIDTTATLRFENEGEFTTALDRLRQKILACQETATWRTALRAAGNLMTKRGIDRERIDAADPETWLRQGVRRVADTVASRTNQTKKAKTKKGKVVKSADAIRAAGQGRGKRQSANATT